MANVIVLAERVDGALSKATLELLTLARGIGEPTAVIPGGETTLDGAQLRAEATTEKENLITQLRENLEEVSRKTQFENKANEAKQQQEMLQKVPLAIYVG